MTHRSCRACRVEYAPASLRRGVCRGCAREIAAGVLPDVRALVSPREVVQFHRRADLYEARMRWTLANERRKRAGVC